MKQLMRLPGASGVSNAKIRDDAAEIGCPTEVPVHGVSIISAKVLSQSDLDTDLTDSLGARRPRPVIWVQGRSPRALGEKSHAVESDDDGGSFMSGDTERQRKVSQ